MVATLRRHRGPIKGFADQAREIVLSVWDEETNGTQPRKTGRSGWPQRSAIDDAGDNAAFTREVGYSDAQAIKAFGEGDYSDTVRLLRPIRNCAHRFGGSHVQREVIDLTIIDAAARSGQHRLAQALRIERDTPKAKA